MFYKLESLRGVAACLVILYHSPFNMWDQKIAFIDNSYLFVDFFFVLSGFVMSLAYSDKIVKHLSFSRYFLLRIGRVYPLHLFLLLAWVPYILAKQYLYYIGYAGTDQFQQNNVYSFVMNVFMLHSMNLTDGLSWNYPSWSISAEVAAYITFYWLTVTLDRRSSLVVPLVIIVIGYTWLLMLPASNFDITYDFGALRCISAFYAGVLTYRLSCRFNTYDYKTNYINAYEVIVLLFCIITVTCIKMSLALVPVAIAMFSMIVWVFSLPQNGYVGRLVLMPIFKKVGLWSYSIYMLHGLVLAGISNVFEYILKVDLMNGLSYYSILINALVIALTILCSKFTYEHIEKRFRDKIKEKINFVEGG